MPENEILADLRRTREAIARESDFDVAKLFAHFRAVTARLEAEGWQVAAPQSETAPRDVDPSCLIREEPPPK